MTFCFQSLSSGLRWTSTGRGTTRWRRVTWRAASTSPPSSRGRRTIFCWKICNEQKQKTKVKIKIVKFAQSIFAQKINNSDNKYFSCEILTFSQDTTPILFTTRLYTAMMRTSGEVSLCLFHQNDANN